MSPSDTSGQRELREQLQTTLGAAYAVTRELGGGGMARVFVAEERTLGRRVVVKVLPPETSGIVSADRFRREIQLAARLQHPHIVPLLAAGESGGLLYYTMPFIDGETLRARIARDGALPLPIAIRVIRDVAKALASAHRHGVVHRDIKPENVLLSEDGDALVADFGVAKALAAASVGAADPSVLLTSMGIAVGTPAYMAPEQALADPGVDHRADLYALGVIAYEVLAGSHPFAGRTQQALVAAHATEAPESLGRRRASVSPELASLVMCLLEKQPADRPRSADDVLQTLDALVTPTRISGAGPGTAAPSAGARLLRSRASRIAVAAVVVVAIAAGAAWYMRVRAVGSPARLQRVLVVPMRNDTRDSALAPLGRMAADWLEQGLVRIDGLSVASGVSNPLSPGDAGLRAAAEANWAGVLVSGAYYLENDSIRLQAKVTDVANWKRMGSIPAVIAPRLQPSLLLEPLRQAVMGLLAASDEARRVGDVGAPPTSWDAYRLQLDGNDLAVKGEWRGALSQWLRASARDSLWPRPQLSAAQAYINVGQPANADSVLRVTERRRAMLTPYDLAMLDLQRSQLDGNTASRLESAHRLVRAAPGLDLSHFLHAIGAVQSNKPREALEAAARVDKASVFRVSQAGSTFAYHVTSAYHLLGDYHRELEAARTARGLIPESANVVYLELRALAALGQVDSLEPTLDHVVGIRAPRGWPPLSISTIRVALAQELMAHGQPDAARQVLSRSVAWQRARPPAEQAREDARRDLAEALYLLGKYVDAEPVVKRLTMDHPENARYLALHGLIALRLGRRAEAIQASDRLGDMKSIYGRDEPTYARAQIAAQLGDTAAALTLLQESLTKGWTATDIHADPDLAPLRGNARFQELLKPMG